MRFLLDDDPGAGKTIMAGLYIKELVLREDVIQDQPEQRLGRARVLVVPPVEHHMSVRVTGRQRQVA